MAPVGAKNTVSQKFGEGRTPCATWLLGHGRDGLGKSSAILNHPRMTAKCWQNVLPESGFEPGTSSMVLSAPLTTTPRGLTVIFDAHGRRGTGIEILEKQKDADCREPAFVMKIMKIG